MPQRSGTKKHKKAPSQSETLRGIMDLEGKAQDDKERRQRKLRKDPNHTAMKGIYFFVTTLLGIYYLTAL